MKLNFKFKDQLVTSCLTLLLLLTVMKVNAQVSLVSGTYSQDFNTLASSGTTNTTLPTAWLFSETGTGANTTYAAGTGSDNGGNTYSFGASASSERAFGGLQSGSVVPSIGASFVNNSLNTINSLTISYTGEQWRLGTASRLDRLNFQYSLNATSLTTGTWTDVTVLNFVAPITSGTLGLLNGNVAPNRTAISSTITGLSIPDGATFFIRWTDFDASGAEDGLGVDDFSLSFSTAPILPTISSFAPTSACSESSAAVVITGTNLSGITSVKFNGTTASFVVNNAGQITATLPSGATTGPITISDGTNSASSASNFTVNQLPASTIVSGGGTFCGNTTITASGGAGGTIYFQGTTTGGTSTADTSSSELISASGTYYFRSQSLEGCWGLEGSTSVIINSAVTPVTIFTESIGSVGVTTPIATHETANGFDNDGFTMTGTGDIRNTLPSSGYTGASGLANVFLTTTASPNFQIANINTTVYQQFTLSFGINKNTTASDGSELVVEVSADGSSYTALMFPALPTGTGTATWYYRTASGTIPATANLRIRFRNTSTTTQFRIDDISLSGSNPSSTITASGPTNFCQGGFVVLSAPSASSYLWSNSATTQNITVTTAGSYSCQLTLPNSCVLTSNTVTITLEQAPTFVLCSISISDFAPFNACNKQEFYFPVAIGNPSPVLSYNFIGATLGSGSGTGSGSFFNVGATSVVVTATNSCGTQNCSGVVNLNDFISPTAVCQNATVILDANGNGTLTASQIDNGSSDNCGIQSIFITPNTFNCTNVNPVADPPSAWINEFHYDNSGIDVIESIEIAGNSGLNLNGWSIVLYNGSGGAVYGIVPLSGNLSNQSNGFGFTTLSFPSNGIQNGSPDGIALIDNLNNVVQFLSYEGVFTAVGGPANGMTSVDILVSETGTLPAGNSLQLSGIGNSYASFTWAPETFATFGSNNFSQTFVAPVGNTVTLTVTDLYGSTSTCTAIVTVNDITPPVANCQNLTVQLDLLGSVTITGAMLNNNSTDACGIASYSVSPNTFTCANVGPNLVALTVTDVNGNSSTCTSTVTVQDVTPPVANCQNFTVNLDNTGNATITAAQINNNSTDNCGISNMSVSPGTFNCTNVNPISGPPSAWINEFHYDNTGTDAGEFIEIAGNSGLNLTGWSLVLYNGNDGAAYSTIPLSGILTNQSNGFGFMVVNYPSNGIQNGAPDGIALVDNLNNVVQFLSYEGVFTAVGGPANGMTSVNIGVLQSGSGPIGNSLRLTGTGTTYASFTWAPEAPATSGSVNTGQTFVAPVGNTVTLTVTDVNGLSSTCTATVTVNDITPPVANCQNITVQLDGNGTATITAAQVNNNSTDACGIANYAVTPTTFTCAMVGPNLVTLTVTDVNGNSSTCTSTVTVEDVTPPVANCQNLTIQLDATGNASITASQINNGSSDICGMNPSMSVSPNTFTCADISGDPVGDLIISEYIEGNVLSNKYIEIYNGTSGNINLSNYRLRLYSNGNTVPGPGNDVLLSGILNAGQTIVYQNSAATLYAGPTTNNTAVNFNGDDAVALFKISTATNVDIIGRIGQDPGAAWTSGSLSTMDQTLRRKPSVVQGVTTNPSSGFPTLSTEWDSFAPGDVSGLGSHLINGGNLVTLTVTDVNGNSSNCTAYVTVIDNQLPSISCQSDITVSNTPGICGANVTYSAPVASDNCGFTVNQTNGNASGAVFPIGTTVNTFMVTDAAGNTATCSFSVTVNDTQAPYLTSGSVCPTSFTGCNPVTWTAPIFTDNCPGVQVASNHSPGTSFQEGITTVIYTATDLKGNSTTCSFNVSILDTSEAATGITSNRDYNNICNGGDITLTVNGGHLGEVTAGVPSQWKWYRNGCGSPSGILVGTGPSITVAPNTTTTYYVRPEGACNTPGCVSITVTVSSGTLSGNPVFSSTPAYGAPGITTTLSVNPVPGATFYRWFTNNGQINGVLFDGQLSPHETQAPTTQVTFVLPQQNYQIRVLAGNACGRTGQSNTHVRGTVEAPASMTGPIQVCPGNTVTYSIPAVTTNIPASYNWALVPSSAGTIIMAPNGLSASVTFSAGFGTAQVCANGVSTFGLPGPAYCLSVSSSAPVPGVISGEPSPCINNAYVYSITAVPGANTYNWTSSIGFVQSVAVDGLSAVILYPNSAFTNETVCVSASSLCGTSAPSCLNVNSGNPGDPGDIHGPANGVCGASGVNYFLNTSDADSYLWTVTANMNIPGLATANSILVDFLPGFTSGIVSVTAYYSCGQVTKHYDVNGFPTPPIILPTAVCPNSAQIYFVSNFDVGATYTWTTNGDIIDEYCTGGNCTQYYIETGPGGGTYNVVASNNCGVGDDVFSGVCRIASETIKMDIYPNPTSGLLTLDFFSKNGGQYNLKVTDLSGRAIMETDLTVSSGRNQKEIDLGFANAGLYMIYLKNTNGEITVQKIAVE